MFRAFHGGILGVRIQSRPAFEPKSEVETDQSAAEGDCVGGIVPSSFQPRSS